MSCPIKILASILLLCQISIMTSYPVINEGEQKQDFLHPGSANSGVIMEENALQRNTGSSDQRNGTLILSLLPVHARVARHSHTCVNNDIHVVMLCDSGRRKAVRCRKASHECNHRQGACVETAWSICTINGNPKKIATDCGCL